MNSPAEKQLNISVSSHSHALAATEIQVNLSQMCHKADLVPKSSFVLWSHSKSPMQPQRWFWCLFIPSRTTPEDNHSTAGKGTEGISPKELQIYLKSVKHFKEGAKWTELPENLVFEGMHPAKCHVLLHVRDHYYLSSRAGAWVHLFCSLDKFLWKERNSSALELVPMTQPLGGVYLLLHASPVSHNCN